LGGRAVYVEQMFGRQLDSDSKKGGFLALALRSKPAGEWKEVPAAQPHRDHTHEVVVVWFFFWGGRRSVQQTYYLCM